ncbi:MAG: recombination protein RecR [Deltaproteobacteria bacterium]|nr:recombination protein RecR [Deltaproteobacteria bacterium]
MADPIQRLVQQFARLPGIGEKTATRLAFHILRAPASQAHDLARALIDIRERIQLCASCCSLTERDPCLICADARRDRTVVCVVAHPTDLHAVERGGHYRGLYHVLHGVLSPLDGVGPDDLRISELLARLSGGEIREAILATSPNVEGEATAMYLARLIKPLGVRATRIASGVPIGGELEYVDQVTLTRAIEGRRDM